MKKKDRKRNPVLFPLPKTPVKLAKPKVVWLVVSWVFMRSVAILAAQRGSTLRKSR